MFAEFEVVDAVDCPDWFAQFFSYQGDVISPVRRGRGFVALRKLLANKYLWINIEIVGAKCGGAV